MESGSEAVLLADLPRMSGSHKAGDIHFVGGSPPVAAFASVPASAAGVAPFVECRVE